VTLLLDTHAFIWWVENDPSLTRRARAEITDPANSCLFSVASAWEIAVKVSIGKLEAARDLARALPDLLAVNRFELLHVELVHAARVAALPFHHRDPFDRFLAAQALEEGLAIVSADAVFRRYGVERVW
jgi:PIN domain nuclease of toxin-antitoxin system